MAGLRELINRDKPVAAKTNNTLTCRCIPMCTANEYMTEITEIEYELTKQIEAIGYDLLDDEKQVLLLYYC